LRTELRLDGGRRGSALDAVISSQNGSSAGWLTRAVTVAALASLHP
jgi:hypothetical protein